MAQPDAPTVDPAAFRHVLGHFCSGVTIVTALDGEVPVGFACQSFSSLSLEPPLVTFFVAKTSTTWPRIRPGARFCVNVLADDQEKLCRGFAVSGADKFAGVDHKLAPATGSPLLADVLAYIDCTLEQVVDGGDHEIVIGRVRALEAPRDDAGPLLFYKGRFGHPAQNA